MTVRRVSLLRSPVAGSAQQAVKGLSEKFPADAVALYLSTLVSQDPETWDALIDVVQPAGSSA